MYFDNLFNGVPSDQGATIAAALNRRTATVTPPDREVAVATPSDLGSTVGGRPTLVNRGGGASKTEP
jgi:hypothetical protein